MNKFLLIFSLVLTTSYAKAAKRIRCVSLLSNDSQYLEALARTEANLKKYFGEEAKIILTEVPNPASEVYPFAVKISVQLPKATYPLNGSFFNYNVVDGVASFSLHVEDEFQKRGLNTLFQSYVLSKHPDAHTMEDTLIEDNFFGFLSYVFARKNKPDFKYEPKKSHIDRFYKLMLTPEGKKELREMAIKAYREYTAAGKTNARLGIENLGSLQIDLSRNCINYTVTKGPLENNKVKVSVIDSIGFEHEL